MSEASKHLTETSSSDEAPKRRPSERFWPYVELPERPTDEELALLDPDLRQILLGDASERPFSMTLVFREFDGPDYDRAVKLAESSTEYRVTGSGDECEHRARFLPSQALALRNLFELVGSRAGCEVLVDDRPVPMARELWLPLMWFLIR